MTGTDADADDGEATTDPAGTDAADGAGADADDTGADAVEDLPPGIRRLTRDSAGRNGSTGGRAGGASGEGDDAGGSGESGGAAGTNGASGRRRLNGDESVVVDFVASFVAGEDSAFDPVKGRVLMSNKRLVLATSRSRTEVPLGSVYDIAVGQVPPEVEQFFDHTVMVGYVDGDRRRNVVIGGGSETIEKFSLLLFRAVLNGSRTVVKHPASVGGRFVDSPDRVAGIHLESDAVVFPYNDDLAEDGDPFAIDLGSVVFFEVRERTVGGDRRLVLVVRHIRNGQEVTTEISLGSRRKMNILGRFLRLRYHSITAAVRELEVSEAELEVLVALYSTAGEMDLARLLDVEPATLEEHLARLHDVGLVEGEDALELTPEGRFVVIDEIEELNT